MRHRAVAVLMGALTLAGCAAPHGAVGANPGAPLAAMAAAGDAPSPDDEDDDERSGVAGFLWGVVVYLPNRVLDLFDVARAGVNAGPGVGAQLKATDLAQVTLLGRASVGVGLQSLRHMPVYVSVENAIGVGPLSGDATAGLGWHHSPTDVRVELHPLLVGAHAAVDPIEILDFALGFLTIDIRDDDL